MSSKMKSRAVRVAVGAATVGAFVVAGAGTAFAAGSAYQPASPPPSTVPGGYVNIVGTQVFSTAGGSIANTVEGESYDITVPAGVFTTPTQVTVYAPVALPSNAVAGVDVTFTDPSSGAVVSGSLAKPVVVDIADPKIAAGDVVEVYGANGFAPFAGTASVSAGHAIVDLTSDPVLEVAKPSATAPVSTAKPSSTVPSATTAHTGKPFLGEELAAGGLAALGAAGLFATRRRRAAQAR